MIYRRMVKNIEKNGVYLTHNGHEKYVILTMEEIDELDRCRAAYMLLIKLKEAEEEAELEMPKKT